MNCEELLKQMNDYVDGDVPPGVCKDLEKHLADCNPCQVVVDNIRKTIRLYKNGEPFDLPVGFQKRLHEALRQSWKSSKAPPQ